MSAIPRADMSLGAKPLDNVNITSTWVVDNIRWTQQEGNNEPNSSGKVNLQH